MTFAIIVPRRVAARELSKAPEDERQQKPM
jgi:hypothetical protein